MVIMNTSTSGREAVRDELDMLLANEVTVEGLTPSVLQNIVSSLKFREEQILHHILKNASKDYKDCQRKGCLADIGLLNLNLCHYKIRKEQKQLLTLAGQHQKVCRQLEAKENIKCCYKLKIEIYALLEEFDIFEKLGQFDEAAQCIIQIAKILKMNGNFKEDDLIKYFAIKGSSFIERITKSILNSFQFTEYGDNGWNFKITNSPKLVTCWRALLLLQDFESTIALLSKFLLDCLFEVMNSPCKVLIGNESHVSLTGECLSNSSWENSDFIECLLSIFDVIGEIGMANNAVLCLEVGRVLWPHVAIAYQEFFLKSTPNLVKSTNMLDVLQLVENAKSFEDKIEKLGFLECTSVLHTYCEEFLKSKVLFWQSNFLEKIRGSLGAKFGVEGTISANLDPSSDCFGCNSALNYGTLAISNNMKQIWNEMKSFCLKCCGNDSELLKSVCIATLQKVVFLVGMLPRVLHLKVSEVAFLSCLYHNNCWYLANELLMILQSAKLNFPLALTRGLTDSAINLKQEGLKVLQKSVQACKFEIKKCISSFGRFQLMEDAVQGFQMRKIIQHSLTLLNQYGTKFSLLAPLSFLKVGCSIIEAAASSAVDVILSYKHLGFDQCNDLGRVFEPLAHDCITQFCQGKLALLSSKYLQLFYAEVECTCLALSKLKGLILILSSSAEGALSMWQDGTLNAYHLSINDISHVFLVVCKDPTLKQQFSLKCKQ